MSLGVVVKGPEGVVLAADTRVTVSARRGNGPEVSVNFGNATKLLTFDKPLDVHDDPHSWVAAVTYGIAVIGSRTAHSYMPEFRLTLGQKRLSISEYAQRLSDFFKSQLKESGMLSEAAAAGGMTFVVGGYDAKEPYGTVFDFTIPNSPAPNPRNPDDFGMTWGASCK